jgi:hypothetical protein
VPVDAVVGVMRSGVAKLMLLAAILAGAAGFMSLPQSAHSFSVDGAVVELARPGLLFDPYFGIMGEPALLVVVSVLLEFLYRIVRALEDSARGGS